MLKYFSVSIVLLSSSYLFAQDSRYHQAALDAYNNEDYSLSALYYDSIISTNSFDATDLYNAACTHSLSGNIDIAIQHLEASLAMENDFNWMYYDKDLNPLRDNPKYIQVEKRYKPESVAFYGDIFNQMNETNEAIIISKDVILIPDDIEYSQEEIIDRWGKNIDFSEMSVKFIDCTFLDGDQYLKLPPLKSLLFDNCKGADTYLSINDTNMSNLFITNSDFFEVQMNNLQLDGVFQVWHNKLTYLRIDNCIFNIHQEESIEDLAYVATSDLNLIGFHIHDDAISMSIYDSKFKNDKDSINSVFDFVVNTKFLKIKDSEFAQPLWFQGVATEVVNISNTKFHNYVDFTDFRLPEFNCYMPFDQFKSDLVRIESPEEGVHFIKGDSMHHLTDKDLLDRLLNAHKFLYNNYRSRGELVSANASYIKLKELEISHLKLKPSLSTEESMRLWLNRVMGFYTNHGTSPAKAIIISIYIIMVFSIFYFFFPSDWDKASKEQLIKDFKLFREKNEHGYFKPFILMAKGFLLSFINALTLSANAFVTLGFGTIPTKGLARYVCVFQGLLGWFLLSLFTVALINQVLL